MTAVLASVAVVTGVYGMNFDHMPELHWRYGYLWAIGLMVIVPALLVAWFRKRGWL
jgi:magnesium transporter